MRNIEFLFATEDYRWSTEIHEVPEDRCYTRMDMVNWATEKFLDQPNPDYSDVVLIAVYHYCENEEESTPETTCCLCGFVMNSSEKNVEYSVCENCEQWKKNRPNGD